MQVTLPYDINSESGVISTLIYHPDFILHSEYLKPGYFYRKENACVYWAIQELYKSGIDKIDTFNIIAKIDSHKKTKEMFASMNITSVQDLIDMYKYIARNTLEEYKMLVNRVVALAFKRDMYNKLELIKKNCLDANDDDINKLYNMVNEELNKLAETYISTENIELFEEKAEKLWQEIQSRQVGSGVYGYPSKFTELNKYCPYEKGELIVVAAPRKTGKSMFMLNESIHMMKNNIPVAYLDTEMSSRSFMERMLSSLTKISIQKIKQGNYSASEEQQIKEAVQYVKSKPFTHIYQPNWTNEQIYSTTKILIYKMGLQLLVYDYMKGSSLSSSEQYNELGNKTNFLKNDIAGALNLAVLAGSQLNRNNEIGDSYKIEQYASTILNLKPKTPEEIAVDTKECGNYKLWVKLNRNGDQHDIESNEYIDLLFQGGIATIEQTVKQHENTQPF